MFIMHFNCFGIAAWLEDMVNILPVHLVGALWVYLVEECRVELELEQGCQTYFISRATNSLLWTYVGWTAETPISDSVKSLTAYLIN